jgi:hypothetical protein
MSRASGFTRRGVIVAGQVVIQTTPLQYPGRAYTSFR